MSKRSRTPSPTEANKKLKSKSKSKSSRTCAVCLGSIEKEGWQACPRNGRHGMCTGCAVQVKSKAKEGHRKHACPTCRASLTASKSSSPPISARDMAVFDHWLLRHIRAPATAMIPLAVAPNFAETTYQEQQARRLEDYRQQALRQDSIEGRTDNYQEYQRLWAYRQTDEYRRREAQMLEEQRQRHEQSEMRYQHDLLEQQRLERQNLLNEFLISNFRG